MTNLNWRSLIDIDEMIQKQIENGYEATNAHKTDVEARKQEIVDFCKSM